MKLIYVNSRPSLQNISEILIHLSWAWMNNFPQMTNFLDFYISNHHFGKFVCIRYDTILLYGSTGMIQFLAPIWSLTYKPLTLGLVDKDLGTH